MKVFAFSKDPIFKIIQLLSVLLLMGCCLISCDEDDNPGPITPSNSLNKIMPLGASRVEGDRPDFESYRYELWKLLANEGWDFDYIGTQKDNAAYEGLPDLPFDNDHEGRGGWTSDRILGGISDWVNQTGAPDIVLFSSPGGNDALTNLPYDDAVSNINTIIDILQTANPNVTIVIEQLAPGMSSLMTPELSTYFNRLQQEVITIAAQQTTATSRVITVDMFTGFNDSYLADDVHYNEAGANFIATRYYDVLQNILKP